MNFASIRNKQILVTGSTSGIGLEVALHCLRASAFLYFTGRSQEKIDTLSKELGDTAKVIKADLVNDVDFLVSELEPLDGLVLNAGIIEYHSSKYLKKEMVQRMFDTNFFSTLELLRELLVKKKLKKGASIVFISSLAAHLGVNGTLVYAATKAAIEASVRVYANELAKSKIRVNAIAPGLVLTPLLRNGNLLDEDIDAEAVNYPLGIGKPEDCAALVRFLLSDESRWLTGQTIILDGGFTLN